MAQQTAIGLHALPQMPQTFVAKEPTTSVTGPWDVQRTDVYLAGAAAAEGYMAGSVRGQTFVAGAGQGQGDV